MLSVEEARSKILDAFRRLPAEYVALDAALGRVLAEPVTAGFSIPPFANSSMDGFALRSADTRAAGRNRPVRLRIEQTIAAGAPVGDAVAEGACARIMTGAALPPGADAVIPFEEVEERDGVISVFAPAAAGACVRPDGNDIRRGTEVLPAGVEIGAAQIAVLAGLGLDRVSVARRPRVAILSTGDELVAPGRPLRTNQIYNSNSPMLAAAVREAGGDPITLPAVGDDPAGIAAAVNEARDADLLITSGGASVGDFDHVKSVIGAQGELGFWRVRIRPGKPLIFGSIGIVPVIGLPGNPTSAMVTFEEFVRPALKRMLGAAELRPEIIATMDDPVDNHGGRRTYTRVVLDIVEGEFRARLAGGQDSAMVLPLGRADGLLIVPEECEVMQPGTRAVVQVWHLPAG